MCPHEGRKDTQSGKCFKFHPEKKTWSNAREACQVWYHGDLASIHNLATNAILETISIESGEYDHAWIGANSENPEGTWEWSDGTPMNYTNWSNENQDGNFAYHHAVINFESGEWYDMENGYKENFQVFKNSFICEYKHSK